MSSLLSAHAFEQYQIFYPESSKFDAVLTFEVSDKIEHEYGRNLVGRRYRENPSEEFFLHPERTGLFVHLPETALVVTFLRFYSFAQFQLAVKLFGWREEPKANVLWNQQKAIEKVQPEKMPKWRLSKKIEKMGYTTADFPPEIWEHFPKGDSGWEVSKNTVAHWLAPIQVPRCAEVQETKKLMLVWVEDLQEYVATVATTKRES